VQSEMVRWVVQQEPPLVVHEGIKVVTFSGDHGCIAFASSPEEQRLGEIPGFAATRGYELPKD